MTHPSINQTTHRHPTRRTVLAGAGTVAASALIPKAFATEYLAIEPIEKSNVDWLSPFGALDYMWARIMRTPCGCHPGIDWACDWLGRAEIGVTWAVGEETRLYEYGPTRYEFFRSCLGVSPSVVDALAREDWARRYEVWEPSWGTCPPQPCGPGDLAALALARVIEFAAEAACEYAQHGRVAGGRSPAIMRHPGLRAIRYAAPSPSRHHVPIDVVHELPIQRGTAAGRTALRTRLVLGPGADR